MTAVPCVALSSRVRRPIRPRAGIENVDERVVIVSGHFDKLAAASADELHHRAKFVVWHFDDQAFKRLFGDAVIIVQHHVRLADRKLVALAAHRFDQHRKVEHAAAEDLERVDAVRSARRGGRRCAPAPS